MELDTFEYPVDEHQVEIHTKANRIGKLRKFNLPNKSNKDKSSNNISEGHICLDCGRKASYCPNFVFFQKQNIIRNRYGIYGPSCVIYLGFIRKIAAFMLFCTLVFALPMFIINLSGNICQIPDACTSTDVIYQWSIYNILGSDPGSLPNTALWFVFCFAMILFNIHLRRYALQQYRRINAKNTTDSDYCLFLRRLAPSTKPHDIRNLIENQIVPKENERIPQSNQNLKSYQIRDVIMIYKLDQFMQAHKQQVKKFKKIAKKSQNDKMNHYQPAALPQPVQFANAAIVRFNNKMSNDLVVQTVHISLFQRFMQYLCVFYNQKSQYKINNKEISIENAPHPTDINWHNIGYSEKSRICRKLVFNLASVAILFVSAGVSIAISYWIEVITNNQKSQPVYLTVIIVLITLAFNQAIKAVVIWTTKKQRLDTRSDEQSQQISLIVVQQSLALGFFSIFAPIIVKLPDYVADRTTKSSSFPMIMFVTILIQGILANITSFISYYFEIGQRINKFLNRKKISVKTQSEANQEWKGKQVPFVTNYAFNIKMIWFGFLYGVVTPISVFISMIGMYLFLLFQKILFNSRYSIPYYAGPRINDTMIDLFDWTPFLIGLFNLYVYHTSQDERNFSQDSRINGLIAAMIIIGFINLLIPWKQFVKKITKTYEYEQNIPFSAKNIEITFQQANPATRQTANVVYRQDGTVQVEDIPKSKQMYGQTYSSPPISVSGRRAIKNDPTTLNLD